MTPSPNCTNFIKSFEGFRANAYQDSAGIWTIGWGTIKYINGTSVKKGDTITEQAATDNLSSEIKEKCAAVSTYVQNINLNQNQFDALVSFAYNEGTGALQGSSLLKKVKINPQDPTIRDAFMVWNKAKDPKTHQLVPVAGLTRRRSAEADLYFKPVAVAANP